MSRDMSLAVADLIMAVVGCILIGYELGPFAGVGFYVLAAAIKDRR